MKSWQTQLIKGLSEMCVLAVLHNQQGHGYAIVKALQCTKTLVIAESAVYPLLARLRKKGLIKVEIEKSQLVVCQDC